MDTVTYLILGIFMIYATIHFVIVQHNKAYKDRTQWEKIVSWAAITAVALTYLGAMYP